MAVELTRLLHRPIRHISLPPADLKAGMLAERVPGEIADRLVDLERYYREGKAGVITNDVRNVLKREPIRFAHYAREVAAAGAWSAGVRQGGAR